MSLVYISRLVKHDAKLSDNVRAWTNFSLVYNPDNDIDEDIDRLEDQALQIEWGRYKIKVGIFAPCKWKDLFNQPEWRMFQASKNTSFVMIRDVRKSCPRLVAIWEKSDSWILTPALVKITDMIDFNANRRAVSLFNYIRTCRKLLLHKTWKDAISPSIAPPSTGAIGLLDEVREQIFQMRLASNKNASPDDKLSQADLIRLWGALWADPTKSAVLHQLGQMISYFLPVQWKSTARLLDSFFYNKAAMFSGILLSKPLVQVVEQKEGVRDKVYDQISLHLLALIIQCVDEEKLKDAFLRRLASSQLQECRCAWACCCLATNTKALDTLPEELFHFNHLYHMVFAGVGQLMHITSIKMLAEVSSCPFVYVCRSRTCNLASILALARLT